MVTSVQSPITLEMLRARREKILALAELYNATDVRVFGSVAKGYSAPGSDIDLLVTFTREVSLLHRIGLIQALEELLGSRVDVLTERTLHPLLRDEILKTAVPL